MEKKIILLFVILIIGWKGVAQEKVIPLKGEWRVRLDPENKGIVEGWASQNYKNKIVLPGSLAEAGYGVKTTGSDYGILTPSYKYIGPAWYQREIIIPNKWKNKNITLFLERVLWESRVFIDGVERSVNDALGTAHVHKLGKIAPGKHKLSVRVNNDMIHNIGDKGHAYGDYTQSIWNGIVGKIQLMAKDPVCFQRMRPFSNIDRDELKLELMIRSSRKGKAKIKYSIHERKTDKIVLCGQFKCELIKGQNIKEITVPINGKIEKWSEFNPKVYVAKANIKAGKYYDFLQTEFGYRKLSTDKHKFFINDKPVFLRGNLDCVHFPITGYPSCNVEDWERIFKIYKDYGLNHVRYHSWCPPEAAFKAADRIGIYIQAEASVWIDWWMSTDMVKRGRPEMDTKGHPKGLGYDDKRDSFVIEEMNRVVDFYGNHPSFIMFGIGNELGNSNFNVMKKWVADLKRKDPRIMYAISTARTITEVDEYCATHYIQGMGATRGLNGAKTDWNFEKVYGRMNIPIIAHEIGQWPVYPKWSEIKKYTGVLKPRNLEGFKAVAEKNGIVDQDRDFCRASGALNQIMYKYETESFLRTPSCAGVQLLSVCDYQGQGEALIGWLDCHWDSKGITTPEKFKEHYNTTVPLLRLKKFVWTNNENICAKAQISHHGENNINGVCKYVVKNEKGENILNGAFDNMVYKMGTVTDIGDINIPAGKIKKAQKLTILLALEGTQFRNEWDIWVYPQMLPEVDTNGIMIAKEWTPQVIEKLNSGGKVLLVANELGTDETSVRAHFYPLYWSLTFFPGQGKTCIGLFLDDEHPAFADFPTDFHSNWQWETICKDAKAFVLNDLPKEYKPIAQPVDDFHRNNKEGSIFECKVGNGKLLVTGYNILKKKLPVARQLKYSLLNYMNSDRFNPKQKISISDLSKMFYHVPNAKPTKLPNGYENAILYVDAGAKVEKDMISLPWKKNLDKVVVEKNGVDYSLIAEGVWKEGGKTAWFGKDMKLNIDCPDGILGTLYVHFHDWNNNNREGMLEFEGRKVKLMRHDGKGVWVKFHVMREDSNDGKIILKTKAQNGPNLMITKVVLVKE